MTINLENTIIQYFEKNKLTQTSINCGVKEFSKKGIERTLEDICENISEYTVLSPESLCHRIISDVLRHQEKIGSFSSEQIKKMVIKVANRLIKTDEIEFQSIITKLSKFDSFSDTKFQEKWLKILKAKLENDPAFIRCEKFNLWCLFFKNTTIQPEFFLRFIEELIKANLENEGTTNGHIDIARNIDCFGINDNTEEGQKLLIEIAKIVAKDKRQNLCQFLAKFKIKANTERGLQALTEIAEIAIQNEQSVAYDIDKFGIDANTIEGQQTVIKIAKLIAQNKNCQSEWFGLAQNIKKFKINTSTVEGQKAIREIALLAVENGHPICYINKFEIASKTDEDQDFLIKLATLAVANKERLSFYIDNFNINKHTKKGQEALVKIAILAAEHGENVLEYIEKFAIDATTAEGQKLLIKIAKLCAENNTETAKWIRKSRINANSEEGQEALIEIAKIIARNESQDISSHESVCFYLKYFNINSNTEKGLQALIDIAEIAIKNKQEVAFLIKKFRIDADTEAGQKALIHIAKMVAQNNSTRKQLPYGRRSKHLIYKNSQNNPVIDSDRELALRIQKFKINSSTAGGQKALTEIVILAAENDYLISPFFQNFGIKFKTDAAQENLIEIVRKCAHKDKYLAYKIKNFKIKLDSDKWQEAVPDIALKIVEAGNPLANHIRKLKIKTDSRKWQETLPKIFKLISNQPEFVANFEHFGLEWSTTEIQKEALKIIKKSFKEVSRKNLSLEVLFEKFKCLDKIDVKFTKNLLLLSFFKSNFSSLSEIGRKTLLKYLKSKYSDLLSYVNLIEDWIHAREKQDIIGLEKCFDQFISTDYSNFEALIAKIKASKNPLHKMSDLDWLGDTLSYLNINLTSKQLLAVRPLIEEVHTIAMPTLRTQLVNKIVEYVSDKNKWAELLALKAINDQSKEKNKALLANLFLLDMFDKEDAQFLSQKIVDASLVFKKGQNHVQLLLALAELNTNTKLAPEDKRFLLEQPFIEKKQKQIFATRQKQIVNSLALIRGILTCNFEEKFTKNNLQQVLAKENSDFKTAADQVFFENFKSYFPLEMEEQDFLIAFQRTFQHYRDSGSLFVYTQKVQEDNNPKLKNALMSFVEAVLKDEFKAMRYNQKDSPHLQKVFKNREPLKQMWETNREYSLQELLSKNAQKETKIDSLKILKESFAHGHISKGSLPILEEYLTEQNAELRDKIKVKCEQTNRTTNNVLLHFQLSAIELCRTSDVNTLKNLLEEMISNLDKFDEFEELKNSQFASDLEGLLTNIKNSSITFSKNGLTAVDTDDPWDLFRCGTDVSDSCQNIYRNFSYNKCLMDYVNDGKIRMLALKSADGTIKARSILRILLKEDGSPALFLERIYPSITKPEEEEALLAMAMNRAKEMNIPLYCSQQIKGKQISEKVNLISESSKAPFEYVDALHQYVEGSYIIEAKAELYNPNN